METSPQPARAPASPPPQLVARVRTWLEERGAALLALIEQLVALESPSREPSAQLELLQLLARELESSGMRTRHLRGSSSVPCQLLARPRRRAAGRPYQLLIGHCDTVWPRKSLDEMPLRVEQGRLRGPGAYDMKAGLAQLVFALRALQALDVEAPVSPVVFVNSDEEIGSPASTRAIERLARGANRAYILEPSLGLDGRLKTARKGVGRFTVTVHGRAAHAGLDPEGGASAILELSHVIQQLFELNDVERGVSVNVGTIDGGLGANVVAPRSRAVVDVRVLTHGDAARVEAAIRGLRARTPGTRLEIEGRIGRPPMERTPGNAALWEAARGLALQLGVELQEGTAGGGSDGNTTSAFTPTLDGLGAVGDGAHAPHEFVRVDKLAERTTLLALLIMAPKTRLEGPR